MEQKHLAITSVPVQQWTSVYPTEEALCQGTVFPELNLPFFAGENTVTDSPSACYFPGKEESQKKREEMLLKIQQISFFLDDLRLYLDTHPQDSHGLSAVKEAGKIRKELLKAYAEEFYPLTFDCMVQEEEGSAGPHCYCWQKGPSPWEGACV